MGIYDRDYIRRSPRGGFGAFAIWSVTTWLIIINVLVFVIDAILRRAEAEQLGAPWVEGFLAGPLERWGFFSELLAVRHLQLWRFITFQFLHASPSHLLCNMLGLFFFGPIVESHFGPRRYLAFYLSCGLAGAACYLLLGEAAILYTTPQSQLVGASAGIFGVLIAAARFAPDMEVWLYLFPMKLRVLAFIYLAWAAWVVISSGANAGGEAAHLGGGLFGLLLVMNQHWLHFVEPRRHMRLAGGPRRRAYRPQKDWTNDFNR